MFLCSGVGMVFSALMNVVTISHLVDGRVVLRRRLSTSVSRFVSKNTGHVGKFTEQVAGDYGGRNIHPSELIPHGSRAPDEELINPTPKMQKYENSLQHHEKELHELGDAYLATGNNKRKVPTGEGNGMVVERKSGGAPQKTDQKTVVGPKTDVDQKTDQKTVGGQKKSGKTNSV